MIKYLIKIFLLICLSSCNVFINCDHADYYMGYSEQVISYNLRREKIVNLNKLSVSELYRKNCIDSITPIDHTFLFDTLNILSAPYAFSYLHLDRSSPCSSVERNSGSRSMASPAMADDLYVYLEMEDEIIHSTPYVAKVLKIGPLFASFFFSPDAERYKESIYGLWYYYCEWMLAQQDLVVNKGYDRKGGKWIVNEDKSTPQILSQDVGEPAEYALTFTQGARIKKDGVYIIDPVYYSDILESDLNQEGAIIKSYFEIILWSTYAPRIDSFELVDSRGRIGRLEFYSAKTNEYYRVKFNISFPYCFKVYKI